MEYVIHTDAAYLFIIRLFLMIHTATIRNISRIFFIFFLSLFFFFFIVGYHITYGVQVQSTNTAVTVVHDVKQFCTGEICRYTVCSIRTLVIYFLLPSRCSVRCFLKRCVDPRFVSINFESIKCWNFVIRPPSVNARTLYTVFYANFVPTSLLDINYIMFCLVEKKQTKINNKQTVCGENNFKKKKSRKAYCQEIKTYPFDIYRRVIKKFLRNNSGIKI